MYTKINVAIASYSVYLVTSSMIIIQVFIVLITRSRLSTASLLNGSIHTCLRQPHPPL